MTSRSNDLPSGPGIHNNNIFLHYLVQTRPPFLLWRSGVYNEMARATKGEMGWNPIGGCVRVNQGPHKYFYLKIGGHLIYTFFDEQVAGPAIVPDDRLTLSEAST